MSDMLEIKTLAEGINKGLEALKSEQSAIKGRVDALDDLKLDRIIEDTTKKIEEMQQKQAKIEAAVNRPEIGAKSDAEAEKKSRDAFVAFMRDTKSGKSEMEIKAMSTDVNPDGGYLVRPQLVNQVVDRVFETSPLRQLANVITISSKSVEMLIDDEEAAASWEGEGASSASDSSTPQLGRKEIVAHKLATNPRITTELLQDSALDVEMWLVGKVTDKFARTENTAFVSGTGVASPRGFLTYSAWAAAGTYERNKIEQVTVGASGALSSADDLIDIQNALKEGYQARAAWGMKRATFGKVMKLKSTSQYNFLGLQPNDRGNYTMDMTLLGKPVVFMDDMPAVAANALSIVYADFNAGYTIVDRVGLTVLRDPYSAKGFVEYYTTKRTGGDVTNFDAIKVGKISS